MTEVPLCTISEGVEVQPNELETVLEMLLRPRVDPGEPRLIGSKALSIRFEERSLHVGRLMARSRSGLRFKVDDAWLVLPPPGLDPVVRVGLEWEPVPIADGSAVRCGRAVLRLLAPGETGADGELTLARDREVGPETVPVPSDRLDSCKATVDWAEEVGGLLSGADRFLGKLAARLERSGAPPLAWGWLLSPVYATLGEARGRPVSTPPDELLDRCRRWLVTVSELPSRAALLGDAPLATLFALLPVPVFAPEPTAFHERCDSLVSDLMVTVAWLGRLLQTAGAGLQALPELLYHEGKLYRRGPAVGVRTEAGTEPTAVRFLDGPPGRVNLAVLWDAPDGLLLGDVRFVPPTHARGPARREEIYLGNLAPGIDFHWLPDTVVGSARLQSPHGLALRDAATYDLVTL